MGQLAISADNVRDPALLPSARQGLRYVAELLVVATVYVVLAKLSLKFASINPSATPIWPPTGIALAILILRGTRLWPAIFLAAFAANISTAGTVLTSLAIAGGNTLEALIGTVLVNAWAGGRHAFASQISVGKFAAIAPAGTAVSASIGVLTLCFAGFAPWTEFGAVWITWWLGDLAGALVVAPAIILWAQAPPGPDPARREKFLLYSVTALAGLLAFTATIPLAYDRGALAFLAVIPLLWSGLRCGQKETATVGLILSAFAAIGTASGMGPFAGGDINHSFLLLLAFMLSVTVPSLALSASIVKQRKAESDTRREAQRILEETREQLAQAQKMEALGQLTGGIAHDFNNLLHIVNGYAQLLQLRLTDERTQRATHAIRAAVTRGQTLTRQLLSFARRQKLEPETLDLKEHLQGVREMLRASLHGNIELVYDIQDIVWPVTVDAAELEFALVNIAVNARDAMPEGGRLVLSAHNVKLLGEPDGLDGDFVCLAISDTGEGIAPDVMGRVFEPFFTTKPVGRGTGLGLSQVYGFARQSGGAASVASKRNHGTVLTLHLPRSRERIAAAAGAPPIAANSGRGRILVVEDNGEVRKLISDLLAQLGYEVETVETATDALGRLRSGPRPDLVFSDIVMPGAMNGYQLADEIRKSFPGLPVLLTSGYNDIARDPDCPFEVMPKPFDLATLGQSVSRALRQPLP